MQNSMFAPKNTRFSIDLFARRKTMGMMNSECDKTGGCRELNGLVFICQIQYTVIAYRLL